MMCECECSSLSAGQLRVCVCVPITALCVCALLQEGSPDAALEYLRCYFKDSPPPNHFLARAHLCKAILSAPQDNSELVCVCVWACVGVCVCACMCACACVCVRMLCLFLCCRKS